MNEEYRIYNCHTHLFTLDHMPRNYYGLPYLVWFTKLISRRPFGPIIIDLIGVLNKLLGYLFEFKKLDEAITYLSRLMSLYEVSGNKSQRTVFEEYLRSYYPEGTRFVVLPMDFSRLGYGQPKLSIDDQLEELKRVRDDYPEQIIPFVHIDPEDPEFEEKVRDWIVNKHFKGVKIYPPFGYFPTDSRLTPIYNFCETYNGGIPVMTHCSDALVRPKEYRKNKSGANWFCAPSHYEAVLRNHPDLRLCLGHFGGHQAWSAYFEKPLASDRQPGRGEHDPGIDNWLHDILAMLKSGEFPNLYVDISYTVFFSSRENLILLKLLLENPCVRSQVLFGTDFYVIELLKFPEKKLPIYLKSLIGENYFREIAEENPERYLFGDNTGASHVRCTVSQ